MGNSQPIWIAEDIKIKEIRQKIVFLRKKLRLWMDKLLLIPQKDQKVNVQSQNFFEEIKSPQRMIGAVLVSWDHHLYL